MRSPSFHAGAIFVCHLSLVFPGLTTSPVATSLGLTWAYSGANMAAYFLLLQVPVCPVHSVLNKISQRIPTYQKTVLERCKWLTTIWESFSKKLTDIFQERTHNVCRL